LAHPVETVLIVVIVVLWCIYAGDVVYFTVSVRAHVHSADSRSDSAGLQGRHCLLSISGLHQVDSFHGYNTIIQQNIKLVTRTMSVSW